MDNGLQLSAEQKNDLFENIIENNWDAIVFANMEGTVEFVNSAANNLYGYEGDELIGQNVDIFNSHLTHNTDEIVAEIMSKGHWHGELIQRRKDDSTFDALLHVQVIKNKEGIPIGLASNSKDITQDKETAKKLKQIISEKEILIKEIHHRVKNNLSTVQGMLRLQLGSVKQNRLDDFLLDFQARLSVLAEAHNNLSVSTSIQEINLGAYVQKITYDVSKIFENEGKKIDIDLKIDSSVVPIDLAIPCGLIVNEVVTNSFKHAFKSGGGQLSVQLKTEGNTCKITIKDDGDGFELTDEMKENSLGMSLLDGLADQLDGNYKFEVDKGSKFTLMFNLS